MPAGLATVCSPLRLGDYPVGALTAGRIKPPFTIQEQTLLDRMEVQIAAPVQSHRYYRLARSQAYQIEQLRRQLAPEAPLELDLEVNRDLLVDAAHALRNPLTAIKGFSSSLLQSDLTWSSEDQQEFLKTIDRETDRLEQVVRDLLAPPGKPGEPSALSPSAVTPPPHSWLGG
jgi:signal transduction histidine kinase